VPFHGLNRVREHLRATAERVFDGLTIPIFVSFGRPGQVVGENIGVERPAGMLACLVEYALRSGFLST